MNEPIHVFVSVGTTFSEEQERFVSAIENRLRLEGLIPHTVGRDTFSSDAPLKAIVDLMEKCSGAVIIALERVYFPAGVDKPNSPREKHLAEVRLATPWNQIEAAMAYARNLPLLVLVQSGVKGEGLLEANFGWYVQDVSVDVATLSTPSFNGILSDWKRKIGDYKRNEASKWSPNEMSIAELIGSLKVGHLWSVIVAAAGALAAAFTIGSKLFPHR